MSAAFTQQERLERADELGIAVDPECYYLLEQYTWHLHEGYPRASMQTEDGGRTRIFLHHLVAGFTDASETIDHINRNKCDARNANLRKVSYSDNSLNTDTHDMTGIFLTRSSTYQVSLRRRGIQHYVGRYATVEEAKAARDAWLNGFVSGELDA